MGTKSFAHWTTLLVLRCVDDKCCRSTNFLKTLDLDKEKDGDNCELLHDAVVSTESGCLLENDNYDHFTLNIPARVSILNSLTEKVTWEWRWNEEEEETTIAMHPVEENWKGERKTENES